MGLATAGAERGTREEPAADGIALDDVENRIIERVEAEKNAAHGLLLDELRTYKERLSSLDFEGRFATIRQAAPAAVSEFRRLFLVAVASGALAGLLWFAAQYFAVIPLIQTAEQYEAAAVDGAGRLATLCRPRTLCERLPRSTVSRGSGFAQTAVKR